MTKIGPLLQRALEGKRKGAPNAGSLVMAEQNGGLRLIVKVGDQRRRPGEIWSVFKERVARELEPVNKSLFGGHGDLLFAAGALSVVAPPDKADAIANHPGVSLVELDPVIIATLMDDAIVDVGVAPFRNRHGAELTGTGVRVAVLDSGVDDQHPLLAVEESISTCGEDVALPGIHGTHVAGSIASRDQTFPGVAPDVTLLNVKVLRRDGSGQHTDIIRGIGAALDLKADVLSMSLGLNHLPTWSDGGHGWACPDGRCPICTAVDNATAFGAVVVVAAGNEHERAEVLRRRGESDSFDTELSCPGQSRGAVTVGAITKSRFLPAEFSSHGPTAYGASKPDLVGPGVNVMSTIPAPRTPDGKVDPDVPRANLFRRLSGTSMATPIVAGAIALIIQHRRSRNLPVTPDDIREALLAQAASPVEQPKEVVGMGRIDLGRYGVDVPVA